MLVTLPERRGPRPATTDTNPHAQIGVAPDPALKAALFRRAFSLPDVEEHPTVVSVPGSRDLWLRDDLPLAHSELALGPGGRGFAHIHPDASLHAIMPPARAAEAVRVGWAELHPLAARLGLTGRVMLYTPRDAQELDVILSLVVDAYNYWTGRALTLLDLAS